MITPEQILKMAEFVTSYNGYDIYTLGGLLLKRNTKTGIITGTVLTERKGEQCLQVAGRTARTSI